ncbi:unnamed protein product [Ceutorhynchus assimilis]|uniref:Uncharacterized protein n=1 Tax=Ceutorhynchus assimilis TaxID=467358 RepID=A0A9N9MZM9_9CUCU|nr:unnamed protein product [Ceutorhynchus assimilis]
MEFAKVIKEVVGLGRTSFGIIKFEIAYQWTYLNYTWESAQQYNRAIESGRYVPANNAPTGLKFYGNLMFISVPRFRPGIPATLVSLEITHQTINPLLSPYPNWQFNNDHSSCKHLQSVQSMEVDTSGTMWIIDGVRINNYNRCPAKLVLLNLNQAGSLVHLYEFPERLSSRNGGFLNDIVLDETDGGFAYITENGQLDPGIIVYSRRKNQAWKLRDVSMLPEPNAVVFRVEDVVFDAPTPIDGIALSPSKTLFYCAISSYSMYSIETSIIKNRVLVKSGIWKRNITFVGTKSAQSDGIIIDNKSNMYLTMLPQHAVAMWNINEPIASIIRLDQDRQRMVWPDGFAFDQRGFLYLISNKIYNYIDLRRTPVVTDEVQFRVLRLFTGTTSYLNSK